MLLSKWLIAIGLGIVIYFQIFKQDNWNDISTMFSSQLRAERWVYIAIVFCLMPLNWLLEAIKWRTLISRFEDISLLTSIKAILLGVVMAIITPARVGEYLGRLSIVKEKSLSFGATLLGSIAQNIVTFCVGLVTVFFFLSHFIQINYTTRIIYYLIVLFVILILLWLYYHLETVLLLLKRMGLFQKFINQLNFQDLFSYKILHFVLGLSFLRYLVYMIQYLLLLWFFGIESDIEVMIAGIAILFLIQSGIPLPPVIGVLARGELAILIWSNISDNSIAALSVSFSLWIINLIIPALVGLIILFNTNLIGKNKP